MVDYLSSGGIGTAGTDLFAGYMPDAPNAAVAVYETGGISPIHRMSPTAGLGAVVVERPSIQVVCRNVPEEYLTARTKAHSVFKLLSGLPDRSINGVSYKWGEARHSPFLMGRDEAGRILIACNYDIIKEMTP